MDSADEQAAAIRRELDGKMQLVLEMEKVRRSKNNTTQQWKEYLDEIMRDYGSIFSAEFDAGLDFPVTSRFWVIL